MNTNTNTNTPTLTAPDEPAFACTLRGAVDVVARQFAGFAVELSDRCFDDLDGPVPATFEVLVWKVGADEFTADRLIGEWAVYWADGAPELVSLD